MTGRELIIYILENGLEDKEVFGGEASFESVFYTADEAAILWGCGSATVKALIEMRRVKGFKIGDCYFVLAKHTNPFEKNERTDLT